MRFHRKPKLVSSKQCANGESTQQKRRQNRSKKVERRPQKDADSSDSNPAEDKPDSAHIHVAGTQLQPNNTDKTNTDIGRPALSVPRGMLQNEEYRDLAAQILHESVVSMPAASHIQGGLEHVVGHEDAKAALEEALLLPLLHPELFAQSGLGGSGTGGLLLAGPPGK